MGNAIFDIHLSIANAATICTIIADARTGNFLQENGNCIRAIQW